MRECVCCGAKIKDNRPICGDCFRIYGPRREFPKWLTFLIADRQREIDYDRNHPTVGIDDRLLYSD
jgi:hypothetical protein